MFLFFSFFVNYIASAYAWILPREDGRETLPSWGGHRASRLHSSSGFPLYWFAMTFDASTLTMLFPETCRVTACIARVLKTGMRHSALRSYWSTWFRFTCVFPFLRITGPGCAALPLIPVHKLITIANKLHFFYVDIYIDAEIAFVFTKLLISSHMKLVKHVTLARVADQMNFWQIDLRNRESWFVFIAWWIFIDIKKKLSFISILIFYINPPLLMKRESLLIL